MDVLVHHLGMSLVCMSTIRQAAECSVALGSGQCCCIVNMFHVCLIVVQTCCVVNMFRVCPLCRLVVS